MINKSERLSNYLMENKKKQEWVIIMIFLKTLVT